MWRAILAGLALLMLGAGIMGGLARQPEPNPEAKPEPASAAPATMRFFVPKAPDECDAWRPIERWTPPADGRRVVVLIHGLDEPGSVWNALGPALARAGFPTVRIDYPNDQAIARSAAQVAGQLDRLGAMGISRAAIVAHSMGGLVIMDALSRPGLDRTGWPEVDRLITLGTPAAGSPLARFQPLTELREQAIRAMKDGHLDRRDLSRFAEDGRGAAAADLEPGSDFLTDLAKRDPPTGIAITAVVGRLDTPDSGEIRDEILDMLPDQIGDDEAAVTLASDLGRWASHWLGRAATLAGDGVVPEASAEGFWTEDVVRVSAMHRAMIKAADCPADPQHEPPAVAIVLDRLSRDQ